MGQLEELQIFVRVAEAGGIGKAAEQLQIAKSAVSRRLVDLEKRLGTRLLQRTTRKSSLTEAGLLCYEHAIRVLDANEELASAISQQDTEISGNLRLAAPLSFGLTHLTPALDLFVQQYPKLKLDIDFADHRVDLVAAGFDLAIRIGQLQDSSLKARKIAPTKPLIVASPAYLATYGKPSNIDELSRHKLLLYGNIIGQRLSIVDPSGLSHQVDMDISITANNGDFLNDMAVRGHGLLMTPDFISWRELQDGRLEPLMQDHQLPQGDIYAVYPQSRFVTRRVRALIDFLIEYFGDTPCWLQANQ